MQSSRVRIYLGCSFDGFIAGPDDELDWLMAYEAPSADSEGLIFTDFMAEVGALLMGRRTYDVVARFDEWPYGDTPVLVATRRALEPKRPTVRAVSGSIEELVAGARDAADGKDVYLDGADLARQALDADLVDEMTLTFAPLLLGGGVRLFDGLVERRQLAFRRVHRFGSSMIQVVADVSR